MQNYLNVFINIIMQGSVNISSKKAPTKGTINKAFSDTPYL